MRATFQDGLVAVADIYYHRVLNLSVLNLCGFLVGVVVDQPAHRCTKVGGAMLGQQPRHGEAAMSVAPRASNLDHLDTACGDVAEHYHIPRHVSMLALPGLAPAPPPRTRRPSGRGAANSDPAGSTH
jgi:hypothetical protein